MMIVFHYKCSIRSFHPETYFSSFFVQYYYAIKGGALARHNIAKNYSINFAFAIFQILRS